AFGLLVTLRSRAQLGAVRGGVHARRQLERRIWVDSRHKSAFRSAPTRERRIAPDPREPNAFVALVRCRESSSPPLPNGRAAPTPTYRVAENVLRQDVFGH